MLNCERPLSASKPAGSAAPAVKPPPGSTPTSCGSISLISRPFARTARKQRALKIDTVREMERLLNLKPLGGRVKIALVDPADRLVEPPPTPC